ncbi:thiaminase II [Enterococcus sp. DIV0840]|uniref:thiaminase II n=1 Tax=Enterococcus TaxID=1350 RepID=UPI001A8BF91F|nr:MULTISPECIES: thiaminase II [Enterococcus]MBO0433359.1 thiaminase II [Enterococcus sp. DIV0849a]MBO0473520.1 thiaminase II [Enterococcus ureasiticus]
MTFTEEARKSVDKIWQESKEHPFILELKAGTLAPEIFRYYLIQDRYYLEQFSQIHLKAAALTMNKEIEACFLEGVKSLEAAEISVRKTFFKDLNVTEEEIDHTPIAPSAYQYTSHMYREIGTKSLARTAAALLPCYWLYQEIGEELIYSGSPDPLYQRWIETYDSEGYRESVIRQRHLTDYLAEQVSTEERSLMKQAFIISSYEELNFWEMAYTKQKWGLKHD